MNLVQLCFRLLLCMVLLNLFFCESKDKSAKKQVKALNNERFENRDDKRNAGFIVDVLEHSYAIREMALKAEHKTNNYVILEKAKRIAEEQTSVITRFKTYAEDKDISTQLSGSEKTRSAVIALNDKTDNDFDREWCEELAKENRLLKRKLENYNDNVDSSLQKIISFSLSTIEVHQDILKQTIDSLNN